MPKTTPALEQEVESQPPEKACMTNANKGKSALQWGRNAQTAGR